MNPNNKFWISLLRNAEGVDGGGASAKGEADTGAGAEAAPDVAGDTEAAATSFLSTGGTTPAETPEGETPPEKGETPEAFSLEALTLPKGFTLDEATGKEFAELLGKNLSPKELGQSLVDLHAKTVETVTAAVKQQSNDLWTQMQETWQGQIKELPEFKSNPDAEAGKVMQGLKAVGAGDEFFAALDLTGAGNHPAVAQVLHRLVQPFLEGAAVGGVPKPAGGRQLGGNIYTSAGQ